MISSTNGNYEAVMSAAVNLLSELVTALGQEKASEVWENFASLIGPDIKNDILFRMMNGELDIEDDHRSMTLRGKGVKDSNLYIGLIRTIRSYTGLGLKESKDLVDDLVRGSSIKISVERTKIRKLTNELNTFFSNMVSVA